MGIMKIIKIQRKGRVNNDLPLPNQKDMALTPTSLPNPMDIPVSSKRKKITGTPQASDTQ